MVRKLSLNSGTYFSVQPTTGVFAANRLRRDSGLRVLALAVACVALAGCSSAPKQAYPETFSDTNTYSRTYPASDGATCEAARRALLSQGYMIGKAQTDGVEGQKNFQVEEDKHQVILFHVVCTSDRQASPSTTVFVSAVQDRYIIKKTSSSAGVGLSVIGSVSMPFGSSDDSLSKISSQTISDSSFYNGFFDLVQRYLPESKRTGMQSKPADAKQSNTPDAKQSNTPTAPPSPGASPSSSPPPSPSPASSPASSPAAPSSPSSDAPPARSPTTPAMSSPQGSGTPSPPTEGGAAAPAPAPDVSKPANTGDGGASATP